MKDGQGRYQTTVLLGGTSEIGQAIVRSVGLAPGGRVVLAGRTATQMDNLPSEVKSESAIYDASAPETHDELVASLVAAYGDLDLVIAAAGVLGSQQEHDADTLTAVRTMQTNYVGNVSVLIAVARQLKAQGHGTIVVLSSVAGLRGRASNYLYGSTKAGLDAFASGLADALVGTGVNVVIVRPGFVHSRMTKGLKSAPQSTTPEAVGQVVAAALKAGKTDVYAPSTLGLMFVILRNLPRSIFRKLPA